MTCNNYHQELLRLKHIQEVKPQFTLRPYQAEAVDRAVEFMKGKAKFNALEVLPTGSGKSLIIANIVKELGEPTLIFQPSKEILEQNYAKLKSYGYNASIYSASFGRKEISDITFATIGSVAERTVTRENEFGKIVTTTYDKTDLFKEFKYIIVDEAHFVNPKEGMYKKFFERLGDVKILGLTATPYRLSTDGWGGLILKFLTRTIPRVFKDVIFYVQNGDLFDAGYLAELKYYQIGKFKRDKLKINSTGADYTDKSLQDYFTEINFSSGLGKTVQRLVQIERKNILVFTRFLDESRYLISHIPGAEIVTGETKKSERERILSEFRSVKIKVVSNVGVLTTGFDYPELETIVLARPTLSLALYYQMIGRGIRPHPEKDHAMVVDLCGNYDLFGKVEDLKIVPGERGKWSVWGKGKQLTNVYFERN